MSATPPKVKIGKKSYAIKPQTLGLLKELAEPREAMITLRSQNDRPAADVAAVQDRMLRYAGADAPEDEGSTLDELQAESTRLQIEREDVAIKYVESRMAVAYLQLVDPPDEDEFSNDCDLVVLDEIEAVIEDRPTSTSGD